MDLKSSLKCGPTECTKIMCTVGPLTRGQEAWVAFRGRLWAKTLKKVRVDDIMFFLPEQSAVCNIYCLRFQLGQDRVIRLSSLQASQLTKLPHIGEPESAKVETQEVFTEVMPQDTALKPEVAPLWIWVLSACAGTLILLLLIFLLWKVSVKTDGIPGRVSKTSGYEKLSIAMRSEILTLNSEQVINPDLPFIIHCHFQLGFFKRNRPSTAPEKQPLNRNGYQAGDEAL